jgi:uncharacterized NAD(P)/FAD-binding protein YdhS
MTAIALIGSGVAATAFIKSLAAKIEPEQAPKLRLDIYDSKLQLGSSHYNGDDTRVEHLTNMRFEDMSLGEPKDFLVWCQKNDEKIGKKIDALFGKRVSHEFAGSGDGDTDSVIANAAKSLTSEVITKLSALAEQKKNFQERYFPPPETETDNYFIPRFIYGMYLEDEFNGAVEKLQESGVKIGLYPSNKVTRIAEDESLWSWLKNSDYEVTSVANGNPVTRKYDKVINATGHLFPQNQGCKPLWPADNLRSAVMEEAKNYAEKKFDTSDSAQKKTFLEKGIDVPILIKGSSLSSIDALKTLFPEWFIYSQENKPTEKKIFTSINKNYKGGEEKIDVYLAATLASRNGCLPTVRGTYSQPSNEHFTVTKIDESAQDEIITPEQAADLLRRDIKATYQAAGKTENIECFDKMDFIELLTYTGSKKNGFEALKEHAEIAKNGEKDGKMIRQALVTGKAFATMRHCYIHRFLPHVQIVLDHYRSRLLANKAPVPLPTAEDVLNMHDAGIVNLQPLAGKEIRVPTESQSMAMIWDPSRDTAQCYSVVINATGHTSDILNKDDALISSLREQELAYPDIRQEKLSEEVKDSDFFKKYKKIINPYIQNDKEIAYNTGQLKRSPSYRNMRNADQKTKGLYTIGIAANTPYLSSARDAASEGNCLGEIAAKEWLQSPINVSRSF